MTAGWGPLFAYVHPHDLEWWCWNLAKAQARETGLTIDGGADLLKDQVLAIEDVFPSFDMKPGNIRLSQFAPGSA